MGRKKKKPIKPWCWYCNREFDDDKILIQHQRAKHYKCPFCHKKLYSGPGLTVHCIQVHKETLDRIPEALPNRNSVDIDIYGMQGIPEEDVREHERLKRGPSPPPKAGPEPKSQQSKSSQQAQLPTSTSAMPPNPMQAAMFQQAMGVPMPPGFPMPMGMPPMFPPGFIPPPGFPPMAPPTMLPGMPMPMPGQGFGMPSMMPPSSMGAGFPPPPPPQLNVPPPPPPPQPPQPPPPPSPPPRPSPPPSQEPSSSKTSVPPSSSPMPGVGHLLGIPPPNFNQSQDIPSQNARVMHPDKDLSLEEIRLELPKYSKFRSK